jgi:hypothetical protein
MSRTSLTLSVVVILAGCAPAVSVQAPGRTPGPAPRANPSASVHVLGIPPGQLPRAGRCRVWVPGMPPGRQERARSCRGIMETAPAGSWVLYRPSRDRAVIHVHVVDNVRTGVVVVVRFFDVANGVFIREEAADNHRDDDEDDNEDRGRDRGRDRERGRPRP